jgi:hypothetical protein
MVFYLLHIQKKLCQKSCEDPFSPLQPVSDDIKKNSTAWVRERTIPTKRPPLVGEVMYEMQVMNPTEASHIPF